MTAGELFSKKIFWLFMLMMLCAGASEQSVSQWASTLAEQGLGVSKTVGDLAGPMTFAMLMGIARLIYGKWGDRMNLNRFMQYSCILCIVSYLCIGFAPIPALGLVGCAICGFSVGILWPGTFSKASASLRGGGTLMFAMLALAGDMGCSGGPTLVGIASSLCENNLRLGILSAILFPVLLLLGVSFLRKRHL
jgi:MFS family permease